jgi:hypothetical protein
MSIRRPVTVLRFDGPRFEDHGLDVDVLPEIVAYKRLLQETAKEIWRRQHPGRQRLPKNIDGDISLKFFNLEPGSTIVPLVRDDASMRERQFPLLDQLEVAADLLVTTIQAAAQSESAPTDLPRNVILLFGQLGNTLRSDERLFVATESTERAPACFDQQVRTKILRWAAMPYSDTVDLVGEVRGTDLDGLRFTLRLQDGRKIPGRFRPEHEQLVLTGLGEHASQRIRVQGTAEFDPADGALREIVSVDRIELIPASEESVPTSAAIWEQLAALGRAVPNEVWQDVPTDLASNVDKYRHGSH